MTAGPPERLDLVVVGGGVHGAGVLQAAAAAGQEALLLEERALAAGTSSRSSKLIHGGLRYLETFQLGLVRESLSERAVLLGIAPHLVRLVPFFVPVYRDTSRPPWKIRAGLSLYALLGGLDRDDRFAAVPRGEWEALDGLELEGLKAVFRYQDGQTDDAALVRAVARSARDLGAHLACPGRFLSAERAGELWRVGCEIDGEEREISCAALVNAAGPWVDAVQARITPPPPRPAIELVQGSHVELAGALERGIYYAEAPRDRRAVFLMPWKGHTLVGTTEVPFRGDPAAAAPSAQEIDYLLEVRRRYFPRHRGDLVAAWSGLRVLPAGAGRPFHRRRDVELVTDDPRRPRLVALYGGKLTGYRSTAEKVLRRLAPSLPARKRKADTATLRLP